MRRIVINLALTLALAMAIAYAGGLTRPYKAFGGEDMLAITVAAVGVYEAVKGWRWHHGRI